ncbi:uncharacterized protein LOC136087582 [Hydra vulgaris]|uniref:Uncharacterized protein LOC136087582 n=1 Tax=Hydra vulgaris TaxID=6087 RepID=A0ABM4CY31_HYDVU
MLSIFTFLKEAPEQRATTIKCSVIRQIEERQEMLITLKKKVRLEGDARLLMETRKKIRTGTSKEGVPKFLGKRVKHKMVDDDGKDLWYSGLVVSVLDDNEFDEDCEFQILYNGHEDKYNIELVKERRTKCAVAEEKADGYLEDVVQKMAEEKADGYLEDVVNVVFDTVQI